MSFQLSSINYFLRRVAAYSVDGLLLYMGVLAVQAALYLSGLHPFRAQIEVGTWPSGWPLHLWVFISTSVPFWFYYALLHNGPRQATLGKRLMGLKVTALTGERLGLSRSLLRASLMLVPFEVNHFVVLQLAPMGSAEPAPLFWAGLTLVYALIALYFGVMFLNPRRQSVHDFVSGSVVTRH